MVRAIHDEVTVFIGGMSGVRDEGLLASAVDRPRNLYAYKSNASLFDMAAALCSGIVKNHPFIDGNKRTALLAARAFLFLNGWVFEPDEMDEVNIMRAAARGAADEKTLEDWFREFSTPSE